MDTLKHAPSGKSAVDWALIESVRLNSPKQASSAIEAGASLQTRWKSRDCAWIKTDGLVSATPLGWALISGKDQALEELLCWRERLGLIGIAVSDAADEEMNVAIHQGNLSTCQRLRGIGARCPAEEDLINLLVFLSRSAGKKRPEGEPSGSKTLWRDALEPMIEWMLGLGLDVNKPIEEMGSTDARHAGSSGMRPLMFATSRRVARALLAHGADPLARDSRGWTAMAYALKAGRKDVVEALASEAGLSNPCEGVDLAAFAAQVQRVGSEAWAIEGARSGLAEEVGMASEPSAARSSPRL